MHETTFSLIKVFDFFPFFRYTYGIYSTKYNERSFFMEQYITKGVCSRAITFDIEGDTIKEVKFLGGCQGNTQGVAALVKGMNIQEAISRLEGIDCGGRGTSCPDQLAQALKGYLQER
jgi:uncharacterized protein (TIGR03905 family)